MARHSAFLRAGSGICRLMGQEAPREPRLQQAEAAGAGGGRGQGAEARSAGAEGQPLIQRAQQAGSSYVGSGQEVRAVAS